MIVATRSAVRSAPTVTAAARNLMLVRFGIARPARIPTIETTIKSSMSVKPPRRGSLCLGGVISIRCTVVTLRSCLPG